ncbi:pantoate--beta-alanine ligase [Stenotrophomonas sp.]|uniref:pantoate--beta-alanine ligase n=1 Tax=Stenotrophomonas sp. TaxID=69392 RepID=UPI002FC6A792
MIETVTELSRLRAVVNGWKREGLRVALVPTMGNLHAGHYSLVTLARQYADRVVSSVFVNPTQFGPNEDFTRYPRTPEADTSGLAQAGCDVLWLPTVESMYPFGIELAASVNVPGISGLLEGAHRPGHFDGVCTVVSRLFNQVQPDVAAFGKKDYQQLAVIRQMVEDLAFPIQIVGGDIVRETDGLAMSSRNQYLNAAQRPVSTTIHQVLLGMREGFIAGKSRGAIEADATAALQAAGFQVDYAVVRLPDLSEPADASDGTRVALIAARIGNTRLIDNLEF